MWRSPPDLMISYEWAEAIKQYRSLDLPAVYYSPFTESPLGSAEGQTFSWTPLEQAIAAGMACLRRPSGSPRTTGASSSPLSWKQAVTCPR